MNVRSALFLSFLPVAAARAADPSAGFTINQSAKIPGATLPPGSYRIEVADHLPDRSILRVRDGQGSIVSTFLGVPASKRGPASGDPLRILNSGNPVAVVKAWSPSISQTLEFVFPKPEAIVVAKETGEPTLAIDPESQKMNSHNLSKSDMQIVSLWLLTPAPVTPGGAEPQIAAAPYVAGGSIVASLPTRPKSLPITASAEPMLLASAALFALLSLALARRKRSWS